MIHYDNSFGGSFREHYIGMLRGRLDVLLADAPIERYNEIVKEAIRHVHVKMHEDAYG